MIDMTANLKYLLCVSMSFNNLVNYYIGYKLSLIISYRGRIAVVILTLIIMCGTLHRECSVLKWVSRSSLDRKL